MSAPSSLQWDNVIFCLVHITQVLQLLLGSCEGEEDVRGVVAECLGHTALLAPGPVMAVLKSRLADPSPAVRAAIAAGPRAMVVRSRLDLALPKPALSLTPAVGPEQTGGLAPRVSART